MNKGHKLMGLAAERMIALGKQAKEAARKVEQGDATLNAKNAYGGWAKDFVGTLDPLVAD